MPERRTIADNISIKYEGIFNFKEFKDFVYSWFRERGYDIHQAKAAEKIKPQGKTIQISMQPWKNITEADKILITIGVLISDMKEIMAKVDNRETKMNQGKIQVSLKAFLVTDYVYKWEGKPIVYFLREVIDKWVWRIKKSDQYEGVVGEEVGLFEGNLKSYLNLIRKKLE